jgi:hypothetical protein
VSQRESGYARKERDLYETPHWVTEALRPHVPELGGIWEPASGGGKMLSVLEGWGSYVLGSDIETGADFLISSRPQGSQWNAIITNPPYELAMQFCEHALRLMEPERGIVAMLLRTDFDHAKSRTHLFRDCPAFARKLVLMKRIAWFVEADGRPRASPSFNHAWYVWDWRHEGPPSIAYGP